MKQRKNSQKVGNYYSYFNIKGFLPLFLNRNDISYTFRISQGPRQSGSIYIQKVKISVNDFHIKYRGAYEISC